MTFDNPDIPEKQVSNKPRDLSEMDCQELKKEFHAYEYIPKLPRNRDRAKDLLL